MHDHVVRHLPDIDRRNLLRGAGIGVGLTFLNNLTTFETAADAATIVKLPGFTAFAKSVKVTKNSTYYLVESNGMPAHPMMAGIISWQQQIPTPQPYYGSNAWSIPVKPVLSKTPILAKGHFLRGAIAIAVNGVPIFNALNNRGEDAFLAGELDEFGGHCGRADDYHYHVAPLHLTEIIGSKLPIAYALDGFPIYGTTEIDGKKVTKLDELNGHFDAKRNYHYHGTNTYPYINGGFKGVVKEIEGQVDPQPLTKAFRPAGQPLKGAKIISCDQTAADSFTLKYRFNEEDFLIKYQATLKSVEITFIDPNGNQRVESYVRQ